MKVALIPVMEILNSQKDIPLPDSGPSWEYVEEWENYNRLCNQLAGYSDALKPYSEGSSFYSIDTISNADLTLIIRNELIEQLTDKAYEVEDVLAVFMGGYVLNIDDQDIYFPQCCADLGDIELWQDLVNGQTEYFFAGHPSPKVIDKGDHLLFDFEHPTIDELFAPPVAVATIEIQKSALETAVADAQMVLMNFADRLRMINETENLKILNIDERLRF